MLSAFVVFICAHVCVLFLVSSPSTVIGRVVSIVINTINGVLVGRARSHIFKKSCKIVYPSGAHFNASSAVSVEPGVVFVVAPALSASPNSVFSRFAEAMCRSFRFGVFISKTSAALRSFISHKSELKEAFFAAIANAINLACSFEMSRNFNNNKAIKAGSRMDIFNHNIHRVVCFN